MSPRHLSVDLDGNVVLLDAARARLEPAGEVLVALLQALVELVEPPDPRLSLVAYAGSADDLAAFTDAADLYRWLVDAFALHDTRAVLRPLAARLAAVAPGSAGRGRRRWTPAALLSAPLEHPWLRDARGRSAAPRLAFALGLLAAGLGALTALETTRHGGERRVTATPATRRLAGSESTPSSTTLPPSSGTAAPVERPEAGPGDQRLTSRATRDSAAPQAAAPAARQEQGARPDMVSPETVATGTQPVATGRVEAPGLAGPLFSPSFDASGSAMFFHTGRAPRAQLVEASLDEHQLVQVSALTHDGSRNYHARVSPDGALVAFDSDRDGTRAVYVVRRDGTGLRKVSGEGFAAVPSWSPDGSRLAFVRAESDRPQVWNLWLLDVATGEMSRVTSYRVGQLWGASWFPDGERVCYSHETSLHVLDLRTGDADRFPSPVRGRLVRTPAVAPQGHRVAFQVQGDGTWLLDLRDRSMRRILDDPSAEEFTWHPDGSRLAYHSRRDGSWGIWITAFSE